MDTGILVAHSNERDSRHARAFALVDEIRRGSHGVPYTSDYIFDEATTLAWFRTRGMEAVLRVGLLVLPDEPKDRWLDLVSVSASDFKGAWRLMRDHGEEGLSFTDWTIVQLARTRDIDYVASFDTGLDGWISRIY